MARNSRRLETRLREDTKAVSLARHLRRFCCPVFVRRVSLGHTLFSLSKACGIPIPELRALEAGEIVFDSEHCGRIGALAHAIGASPTLLFAELSGWTSVTRSIRPKNAEDIAQESLLVYLEEIPRTRERWADAIVREAVRNAMEEQP